MLALLLFLGGAAIASEPDSARRAALDASLQAFTRAFRNADAHALDTLLAADYVHTNGGSGAVLDRKQWLEYVRTRRADLRNGKLRLDRYDISEVTIRWHPASAVVSSQVTTEGEQNGVPFTSRLRVTQVWILVGERWRRAAFHDSPLPPAQP
jgi:hypothetical protein